MNPLCPNTNKLCFACAEPCEAPEVHQGIFYAKENEEGFLDAVSHITDVISIDTDFSEEATISVTIPI